MRRFRFLLPLVTCIITLAVLAGCGGGGPSFKPIELVPQNANLIADVQVERIINDPDFQNAYNQSPKSGNEPATWDEALAKFTAETGIDLKQFSDVLVFGDISNASQGPANIGAIAQGTFDETQFVENFKVKTKTDVTTSTYNGVTLYTGTHNEVAFAFLGSGTLLFGTMQSVKDSIDVSKGTRNRLTGQLLDTYNGLGSGIAKVAVQIPESERQKLLNDTSGKELGFSLKPFADTDAVGMSIEKAGSTESFRIEAHFVSSASASDAKDTVSGLISLLKGMAQDQSTKDLLGKIEVTVSGSTLRINFSASLSDIEKALPGLANPIGAVK